MKTKHRTDLGKKVASLASILLLVLAWYLGGLRISDNQTNLVNQLLINGVRLEAVEGSLYKGVATQGMTAAEWIGLGSGVGYGGISELALTVTPEGEIQRIALLSSKDTTSYLDKVLQAKSLQTLLGRNIENVIQIDGVSGATLSTNALAQAVNAAAEPVRKQLFGISLNTETNAMSHFRWLDAIALILFIFAAWLSKTRHPKKTLLNWLVLLTSMLAFGFYSSTLFSSSTMGILISGSWISGLGNYTALILLTLTAAYIIGTNKNIYCNSLCPFGATQECLAKVGNAKATTLKHTYVEWFPRLLLLSALCFGLYFRNPASFSYEPFGIMFGMIGSMYLFVLTALVMLASLVIRRPWCRTLCPMNPLNDFLKFNKNWVKHIFRQGAKNRTSRANIAAVRRPPRGNTGKQETTRGSKSR